VRLISMLFVAASAIAPLAVVAQQPPSIERDENGERERGVDLEEVNRLAALGLIRPLSEVLAVAQKLFPGELIDVNLMLRHGRYIYEVEILRGRRREEIYVDAVTLELRGGE
jgi:uncharacterized membrane protein YkoI